MRHIKELHYLENGSPYFTYRKNHPHNMWFTGANASPNKRYIHILKYIKENDGCRRAQIITNVLGKNYMEKDPSYPNKSIYRGYYSNEFSNLLYFDIINYDKKFSYHITPKGEALLTKVASM